MDVDAIRQLFDFHYWARDRLLEALAGLSETQYDQSLPGGWGSIQETTAHVVAAEEIWFARLRGHSPTSMAGAAAMPTLEAVRKRWSASEAVVRTYLAQLDFTTLSGPLAYQDTKGNSFTTPVWQLLLHVINHATEHRAQLATMLTYLGVAHAGMDMITFWRENLDRSSQ